MKYQIFLVSGIAANYQLWIREEEQKNLKEIERLEKLEKKLSKMVEISADVIIDLDDLTTTGDIENGSY